MKYNYENIKYYVYLDGPKINVSNIPIFLLLLDFFGIIPFINDLTGYTTKGLQNISIVLVTIILFINLWGILLICFKERFARAYPLYIGVYCTEAAIQFLCSSVRFWYMGTDEFIIPFAIIATIAVIISGILEWKYVEKALSSGEWKDGMVVGIKGGRFLPIVLAVGFIFTRILFRIASANAGILIGAVAILVLAAMIALGSQNIYKYYLICKYCDVKKGKVYEDDRLNEFKD